MPICCSRPPANPNYTICFPDQQVVEGLAGLQPNPFYDFANQRSVWTYSIQVDDGGPLTPNISHWGLQVCPDLACDARSGGVSNFFTVERAQETSPGVIGSFTDITNTVEAFCTSPVEPTTGLPFFIKINLGQNKGTTYFYRITIKSPDYFDLAATQVGTLAIKAGNNVLSYTQGTCGVNLPPTPDFECNRVPVPTLSIAKTCPVPPDGGNFFTIGETVTIPIVVNNTGDSAVIGTVSDLIHLPPGVIVGSFTPNPASGTVNTVVNPDTSVDITTTWANQSLAPGQNNFSVSFQILNAPTDGTDITNVSASLTLNSTVITAEGCTIPVIGRAINLNIAKTCPVPGVGDFFNVGDTVTLTINVTNNGFTNAAVTVTDVLNIPDGVSISGFTTLPAAVSITPAPGAGGTYTGPVNITTVWDIPVLPPGSQMLTITFTITSAPSEGALITNEQATLELTGDTLIITTPGCTIPVKGKVPPTRGVSFIGLEVV